MKKFIVFAAIAASVFSMNAQLSVLKSGNVRIGKTTMPGTTPPTKIVSGIDISTDSLASLSILGDKLWGNGGYITFGTGRNVAIGEDFTTIDDNTDKLYLLGKKGIRYTTGSSTVFSYTPPTSTNETSPFLFYGDVMADAFLRTSDMRKKKDIKDLNGLSSMLMKISPVSYRLNREMAEEQETNATGEADIRMAPNDRVQYGFIAQEVREILPELVVEDATGYLSVDYLGFIPILVDAYKNLEARVKEQDETIASLTGDNVRKSPAAGIDGILADGKAALLQNRPNPFKENTSIECVVPAGSTEAFICIYDLQGSQVKRFDIAGRGNCSVSVNGSSLKPGMYIYALIIDGSEIDSKKMILTD